MQGALEPCIQRGQPRAMPRVRPTAAVQLRSDPLTDLLQRCGGHLRFVVLIQGEIVDQHGRRDHAARRRAADPGDEFIDIGLNRFIASPHRIDHRNHDRSLAGHRQGVETAAAQLVVPYDEDQHVGHRQHLFGEFRDPRPLVGRSRSVNQPIRDTQ